MPGITPGPPAGGRKIDLSSSGTEGSGGDDFETDFVPLGVALFGDGENFHGDRVPFYGRGNFLEHARFVAQFFDELGRLMNDAAGAAQGVKREFDTVWRSQAEKFLRDMDLVKREDFEVVRDMARLAREEKLTTRVYFDEQEAFEYLADG